MKKKKRILVAGTLALTLAITSADTQYIFANEFAGKEEYWLNKCSVAQANTQEAQKCAEFKSYYQTVSNDLESEIGSLQNQVAKIQDNMEEVQAGMRQIEDAIKKLDNNIRINKENIETIKAEMIVIDGRIVEIQKSITMRNELIMDRMQNEQVNMGTNMKIEIIMGATDLVDLIRKIDGLQRITESDQKEIQKLTDDQKELEFQKDEQARLKEEIEAKNKEIEKNKRDAEEIKKEKKRLLSVYRQQEAELNEKMRSMQTDMSSIQNNIININTSVLRPQKPSKPGGGSGGNGGGNDDYVPDFESGSMILPVRGGQKTAGTWYYPGGGVHLGLDYGAPIGTPVVAPSDGIVLFASNAYDTTNGFLGNWIGFPAGAGNSIHFLTQVDGITYGISFFHLAKEGFMASPGASFKQGEVLAHVGNSGNTSGPHCHMEVINLGKMSLEAAISEFQSTADFAWGTGWGDSALSRTCSVSGAPCRERPETMFH